MAKTAAGARYVASLHLVMPVIMTVMGHLKPKKLGRVVGHQLATSRRNGCKKLGTKFEGRNRCYGGYQQEEVLRPRLRISHVDLSL